MIKLGLNFMFICFFNLVFLLTLVFHKTFPRQEEIEGLMRENEELKVKTQNLETQLKTALLPTSINAVEADEKRVPHFVVEEWKNKLQAATDVCDQIKQDMDKLKEVHTTKHMFCIY